MCPDSERSPQSLKPGLILWYDLSNERGTWDLVLGMLGAYVGQVHSQQQLSPQGCTQWRGFARLKTRGSHSWIAINRLGCQAPNHWFLWETVSVHFFTTSINSYNWMYVNKTHCTSNDKIIVKTTVRNCKHGQCLTGITKSSDPRQSWTFTSTISVLNIITKHYSLSDVHQEF